MIRCFNVQKSYDDHEVLKNITFSVGKGERISLVGPGGSGKTTILKILLGLESIEQGGGQLMGVSLQQARLSQRNKILRQVGVSFQQGGLFDFMTVKENLFFAMTHMTYKSQEEMALRTKELLETVKLGRTTHLYPHELSGGMRRRVGIARALSVDPKIALLDEPTSGLDPVTSTIILNMILELAGKTLDTSLVVFTSNVEIAIRFSPRIVIVHNGRVIADGPWKDLLLNGSEWIKNFLGVRLIGLDIEYAKELDLPEEFIQEHWNEKEKNDC